MNESSGHMTICRYCEHSEARPFESAPELTWMHCSHHNATVQPDDTCSDFERSPGADDDLGDDDDVR